MATLHLNPRGGRYDDPATWREGRVPTPQDDIACDVAVVEVDDGSWRHSEDDYRRFWPGRA